MKAEKAYQMGQMALIATNYLRCVIRPIALLVFVATFLLTEPVAGQDFQLLSKANNAYQALNLKSRTKNAEVITLYQGVLNAVDSETRLNDTLYFLPLFRMAQLNHINGSQLESEKWFVQALQSHLRHSQSADRLALLFYYRISNFHALGNDKRYRETLDSMFQLLPTDDFESAYLKYKSRSHYHLFGSRHEQAFIDNQKALELVKRNVPFEKQERILLPLEYEMADFVGRSGNKQREIDLSRNLIPRFLNAHMPDKAIQSAYSMALHFYGFHQYDSCLKYTQWAQSLSLETGYMQWFLGIYQYDAECYWRLGDKKRADSTASAFSDRLSAYHVTNRNNRIHKAEALRILAKYYRMADKRQECLKAISEAVRLVEEGGGAGWEAQGAMYGYQGDVYLSFKDFALAQLAFAKQIACHLKDHGTVLDSLHPPKVEGLDGNIDAVVALGKYAEVLYERNASQLFADSALGEACVAYYDAQHQLLGLVLERIPDYASRMRYLQNMDHSLGLYAMAVYQQSQKTGFSEEILETLTRHTSAYRQQFLRSALDKRDKLAQYSGRDSLFHHLLTLNNQYQQERFTPNHALRDSFEQELVRLNLTLHTKYPTKYQAYYSQNPLLISDLQKQLESRECIVLYESFDANLFQLVLTHDQMTFKYLGRTEVADSLIDLQQESMKKGDVQRYADASYLLFELLALDSLSAEKITLVPSGRLGLVPFDALITRKGNFQSFKELPYFFLEHTLVVVPSLHHLHEPGGVQHSLKRYLAVVPSFEGVLVDKMMVMRSADRGRLVPLPAAQEEVHKVSQLFNEHRVLANEKATEMAFKQEMVLSDVIHLATHALLDSNPLESRLVFSDKEGAEQDGFLHAAELMSLNLNAPLVILSACNTGSGTQPTSEGYQSLAYAFAYSGCPNVLMTLWNTSDQASSRIISQFMEHLTQQKSMGQALQMAKLKYLDESDDVMANPYYWSGFGIFGDPNATFVIHPPSFPFVWLYVGSFLLLVLLFWFWIRRRIS